jgi:fructoselysine-6-P-deglycase FrlB-like protein
MYPENCEQKGWQQCQTNTTAWRDRQQPEAWAKLIPLVLGKVEAIQEIFRGVEEVIFSGCGSGLNVSLAGAPIMQSKAHISTRAVPAFEIYKFPESILNKKRKTLAILSSRSGQTTEVVNAMHHLHDLGIPTLGITCTQGSPLAVESSLAFVLTPVTEQAVTPALTE